MSISLAIPVGQRGLVALPLPRPAPSHTCCRGRSSEHTVRKYAARAHCLPQVKDT